MLKFHWERWKRYPLDKNYKVSSDGRIKYKHKVLKQYLGSAGYFCVGMCGKFKPVHRVVAETFLNHLMRDGLTVDHKDSNKRNNSVNNLELVTEEENLKRARAKKLKGSSSEEKEIKIREEALKVKVEVVEKIQTQLFENTGIDFLEAVAKSKTPTKNKNIVVRNAEELFNSLDYLRNFNSSKITPKTPNKMTNRIIRGIVLLGDYGGYSWKPHYAIATIQ